ncbi:hypothetical protein BGX28_008066 [Mortierella sp. GBA30]|nr:hypothetical protein BGX28_008066 [Mortierella sp. GBA30]
MLSSVSPFTSTTPASHAALHFSPENVRSIFWTNLILLKVQDYSSKPQTTTTSTGLLISQPTPTQQQQQHVIIDSSTYGSSSSARPLELHKHIFAKGHQSTKALEFVLWFLFIRLNKLQARERFKDCWPILDRHDAREFRNAAFKWLEELRKEGSFGIGHNIAPPEANGTMREESGCTSVATSRTGHLNGLGVFLPTIRRSYLDESIGERIEQLILGLSTFVLSRDVKQNLERRQQQENNTQTDEDRKLLHLASMVPGSAQEEEALLGMIDSQIVRRSRLFIENMEQQRKTRQQWEAMSREMSEKMQTIFQALDTLGTERREFFAHHHQLTERTGLLTLEELRVLEDRWIEKINDQWRPILDFMEHNVGNKEILQSLLDSDQGKGISVLDGRRLQTAGDPISTLRSWKRSLELFDNSGSHTFSDTDVTSGYTKTLDSLSSNHSNLLKKIRRSRKTLEARLREANKRVEILQREQSILQRPYRRLLSTVPHHDHRIMKSLSPTSLKNALQDANICHKSIAQCFTLQPIDGDLLPDHARSIRSAIHESTFQDQSCARTSDDSLREALCEADASLILSVKYSRAAAMRIPKQVLPVRRTTLSAMKISTATPKPAAPSLKPQLSMSKPSPSITKPAISLSDRIQKEGEPKIKAENVFISRKSSSYSRPVPDDLVVRINHEDTAVQSSYTSQCVEIIPSLIADSKSIDTPPYPPNAEKAPQNIASTACRANSPTLNAEQPAVQESVALGKKRNDFMSSLFRGKSMPFKWQPKEAGKGPDADAKPSQVISSLLSKSIYRDRVGASKKRRQSSDFQPAHNVSSPVHDRNQRQQSFSEPGKLQHTEIGNIFGGDIGETPGTPSKRPRMDSSEETLVGRNTLCGFGMKTPIKEKSVDNRASLQSVLQMTSPSSRALDRKRTLAARSPKLTLDDLRAPTPKPTKTLSADGTSTSWKMPIMFLHSPQQKKLFEMQANVEIPKLSHPFTALTPPSASDDKSNRPSLSFKDSSKHTSFASSIFARFKNESGSQRSQGRILGAPGTIDTHSPSLSQPDQLGNPDVSEAEYPASPSVNRIRPKPLTASVRVNHLLTGNSVVLDRIFNKRNDKQSKPQQVTSSEPEPKTPKSDHTNSRNSIKPTTESEMVNGPVTDLNTSRNPWGRPPSWKPKSPRMIDVENKRHADRANRSAIRNGGPLSLPLEHLSRSNMGSLKVSMYGKYGRSRNVSPPSSTPGSFSSLSSLSSKSLRSEVSLPSHQSEAGRKDVLKEISLEGAAAAKGEINGNGNEDEDDTREFSPPPVSPIRLSHLDANRFFAASVMSLSSSSLRSNTPFLIPKRATQNLVIPTRSSENQFSGQYKEHQSKHVDDAEHQQDPETRRILEEPIPHDEFIVRSREEDNDDTVLNYVLQPIFGDNETPDASEDTRGHDGDKAAMGRLDGITEPDRRMEGLFDEAMPDGLDPEEALWETTEAFE